MSKYIATALLLNWKRPENLKESIAQLRKMNVEILVWNNNPEDHTTFDADKQYNATENGFCWKRWQMADKATTPFVFSLDDDLMLSRDVLPDCVRLVNNLPYDAIIGYTGVGLNPQHKYKNSTHLNSPDTSMDYHVDIVKGRFMFMKKIFILNIPSPKPELRHLLSVADDIYISSKSSFKVVPSFMANSMIELPEKGVGLWTHPNHYATRQQAVDEFFNHYG